MQILAHRGLWDKQVIPNSMQALLSALENGFGLETDFRDYEGRLVISHDIANGDSPAVDELLNKWNEHCTLAINIKADGLKEILRQQLEKNHLQHYFLFDMSVPQMLEYRDMGLRYFTRQSEFEPEPVLYSDAAGVWMDAFKKESWINQDRIFTHLEQKKQVCLVSPELHGRPYQRFWEQLREFALGRDDVLLCTDYPVQARAFFK